MYQTNHVVYCELRKIFIYLIIYIYIYTNRSGSLLRKILYCISNIIEQV